jgi:hypothetical protein
MILSSGEEVEFLSFQHKPYTSFLCLGPTHGGKAIKAAIAKLDLATSQKKIMAGYVWRFSLLTGICDPEFLDFQYEGYIIAVLRYLRLPFDERLIRLPDSLRLGKRDFPGIRDHTPESSLPNEELIALLGEDSTIGFDGMSIDEIKVTRSNLMKSILSKTRQQLNHTELEKQFSQLRTIDGVLESRKQEKARPAQNEKNKAQAVVDCFHHLYKNMNKWSLRLRYQGLVWGLLSSAWSESNFSVIDRYMNQWGSLRTQSDVDVFFQKCNEWVQGQCAGAYEASKDKPWTQSIFTENEMAKMTEMLHNGAMRAILNASVVANKYITFSQQTEPYGRICNLMRSKVRMLAECLGFEPHEITFHRAESIQSDSSFTSGKEDNLLRATRMVNADVTKSVIAVYTPRSGSPSRFQFLSRQFDSFVFFCSCQVQNASGAPCPCQLAWILRRSRRSIENIIWLTYAGWIKGYQLSTTVHESPSANSDVHIESESFEPSSSADPARPVDVAMNGNSHENQVRYPAEDRAVQGLDEAARSGIISLSDNYSEQGLQEHSSRSVLNDFVFF